MLFFTCSDLLLRFRIRFDLIFKSYRLEGESIYYLLWSAMNPSYLILMYNINGIILVLLAILLQLLRFLDILSEILLIFCCDFFGLSFGILGGIFEGSEPIVLAGPFSNENCTWTINSSILIKCWHHPSSLRFIVITTIETKLRKILALVYILLVKA